MAAKRQASQSLIKASSSLLVDILGVAWHKQIDKFSAGWMVVDQGTTTLGQLIVLLAMQHF